MKNLAILITIFFTNLVLGQIIYEPIFIDQCTNEKEDIIFWYLTDSNNTYYSNESYFEKSIELPRYGKYTLHYGIMGDKSKVISIKMDSVKDTMLIKRLSLQIHISNPPHSEYMNCDSLANGKVIDYYYDGTKRMQGIFKNGQLVDTLFTYYRNGNLSEVLIDKEKFWKRVSYFENQKIKSIYDSRKNYEKEYFPNGQLKKMKKWRKKKSRYAKIMEYFEDGSLKMKRGNKRLRQFNEDGVLIERIKRKEILIFDRLFSKNLRRNKFYEYKWKTYDSTGALKRKIIFDGIGFTMNPFPDSIQQINGYLLDKIIFYKKGIEFKKVSIKDDYNYKNYKHIYTLYFYRKKRNQWVKEKEITSNDIYALINEYSKS